jgi:hypothetical protein
LEELEQGRWDKGKADVKGEKVVEEINRESIITNSG